MNLCVIPARGGSKRVPRKNVRDFHGKPMIVWSIEAALESGVFGHVVVSTEDVEIARIAREAGAEVPFTRPGELADDHTPTVPVVAHGIRKAEELWGEAQAVCCLYAAAPFVQAADLREGLGLLDSSGARYVVPVTSFPFPIQRAVRLTGSGRMEMLSPEHVVTRSQDLEEAYHDVGQFYWGTRAAWLDGIPLMGPDSAPLVIPRHRVQDIDTSEDWERAERLFTALQGG